MERAEDEVAGLCGLDGDEYGLLIAHLSDENDVRVLAGRGVKGIGKGFGVDMHLALVDETVFPIMDELDGVLDRDDVVPAVTISMGICRNTAPRSKRSMKMFTRNLATPGISWAWSVSWMSSNWAALCAGMMP
jgi:hypothetical protein